MSDPSLQQSRTADVAVVLRPEREQSEVLFGGGAATVGYGAAFLPRAGGLTPGNLVAVAAFPGADWWVECPVGPFDHADVAVDRVLDFYDEHDLWGRRT